MRHIMKLYNLGSFRLVIRNRRIQNATSHLIRKAVDGYHLIEARLAKGKFSISLQYWRARSSLMPIKPNEGAMV